MKLVLNRREPAPTRPKSNEITTLFQLHSKLEQMVFRGRVRIIIADQENIF